MDKKNKENFEHNDEYCGGCGCGVDCDEDHEFDHELHDHDFDEMEDFGMIHLTLDDDTELDCVVLGIFEVEDDEYIALLPEGEDEVLLYRFVEHEDDEEFDLFPIEEEEEFNLVSEAFNLLFLDDEGELDMEDDDFVEYDSYDELED